MIAWLVSQQNNTTGENNISLVTSSDIDVEDYAIRSSSWRSAPVKAIAVRIEAVEPGMDLSTFFNQVYRSDGFVDNEDALLTPSVDEIEDTSALYLKHLTDKYS